jgi:hypothetical protein
LKVRPDFNKGTSVWDVMHPNEEAAGPLAPKTRVLQKSSSINKELAQNQRRDPIGYFEDNKYGGSFGFLNSSQLNQMSEQNEASASTAQNINEYKPSWNQIPNEKPNDLLDAAMSYQKPIKVGGQD